MNILSRDKQIEVIAALTEGMGIRASYAGFWVTGRSGGVVCRRFDDLDAVFESDTCDDLRQLICALEAPPGL